MNHWKARLAEFELRKSLIPMGRRWGKTLVGQRKIRDLMFGAIFASADREVFKRWISFLLESRHDPD
jgi:hypothetical protein